jgi:hypothetical protein
MNGCTIAVVPILAIKTPQEGRKCCRLGQLIAGDGVEGKRIGEDGGGGGGGGRKVLVGGFWRSGCRICGVLVKRKWKRRGQLTQRSLGSRVRGEGERVWSSSRVGAGLLSSSRATVEGGRGGRSEVEGGRGGRLEIEGREADAVVMDDEGE